MIHYSLLLLILAYLTAGLPIEDAEFGRIPDGYLEDHTFTERTAKFKLYTRKTINEGHEILPNSVSLGKTPFDAKKKTTFFAHGYLGAGWNWYIHDLKSALLAKEDVNFIVVDWSEGSVDWLPDALDAAVVVAKEVASFLSLFHEVYKIDLDNIHLIGHSMGGRVIAYAVKDFKTNKVGRLTGLDPLPGEYKGLANFTDVIHTTFLADNAVADANFWPNNNDIGGDIPWVSPHMYAVYMYTISIARCDFVAHECTNWEDFKAGRCSKNAQSRMGHHAIGYPGRGKMYLRIKKEPPFC